jgi:hypothetical protein
LYVISYAEQNVIINVTKIYPKPEVKCVFQAVMGLKKKGIQIFDQEISRGEVT